MHKEGGCNYGPWFKRSKTAVMKTKYIKRSLHKMNFLEMVHMLMAFTLYLTEKFTHVDEKSVKLPRTLAKPQVSEFIKNLANF